jgi:hypothetical protein
LWQLIRVDLNVASVVLFPLGSIRLKLGIFIMMNFNCCTVQSAQSRLRLLIRWISRWQITAVISVLLVLAILSLLEWIDSSLIELDQARPPISSTLFFSDRAINQIQRAA